MRARTPLRPGRRRAAAYHILVRARSEPPARLLRFLLETYPIVQTGRGYRGLGWQYHASGYIPGGANVFSGPELKWRNGEISSPNSARCFHFLQNQNMTTRIRCARKSFGLRRRNALRRGV
jgi:hypothetical protein